MSEECRYVDVRVEQLMDGGWRATMKLENMLAPREITQCMRRSTMERRLEDFQRRWAREHFGKWRFGITWAKP